MKKQILGICFLGLCAILFCGSSVTAENYDSKRNELVQANCYKTDVQITYNDKN